MAYIEVSLCMDTPCIRFSTLLKINILASLFPLINPRRDFMYNDTIGIMIRLAVQTVLY